MSGTRERSRQLQRDRILDSARLLFSARGFDEVTIAEVAELAGVARATVFNYFPSKHDLVDSITEEVLGYYQRMLQEALAHTEVSVPTLVRALFEQMGLGVQATHGFYRGVFREIAKLQVGLEEGSRSERARARAVALLRQLLARGQQRGELSDAHRADELAHAFDALVNGTITHWLYDDAAGSLQERMRRAAEIFLQPVGLTSGPEPAELPNLLVADPPTGPGTV